MFRRGRKNANHTSPNTNDIQHLQRVLYYIIAYCAEYAGAHKRYYIVQYPHTMPTVIGPGPKLVSNLALCSLFFLF